jgi:uncharacterized protein
VPYITASDYHDNWTYVNGVFDLWFAQSWNQLTFGPETLRRNLLAAGLPPAEVEQRVAEWYAQSQGDLLSNWVWQLPLRSFTGLRGIAPWYYTWLRHPNYDRFWARLDVERRYQKVKVPVLNIGGWYDIFEVGTVRNFLGMRSEGGTPEARAGTKLIMPHRRTLRRRIRRRPRSVTSTSVPTTRSTSMPCRCGSMTAT